MSIYVSDIFFLFISTDNLEVFCNYYNACHLSMSFLYEEEKKNGKMPFLDVEISRRNSKFVTTVYRKPTFSGIYNHIGIFIPSAHNRCFPVG